MHTIRETVEVEGDEVVRRMEDVPESFTAVATTRQMNEDFRMFTGAQDENRTHDLRITSALLYP